MYLIIYVNNEKFSLVVEKYNSQENYSEFNLNAQDAETIRLTQYLKMDASYWGERCYREATIQIQKLETGFWKWKKEEDIFTFTYSACGSTDFKCDLYYLEENL